VSTGNSLFSGVGGVVDGLSGGVSSSSVLIEESFGLFGLGHGYLNLINDFYLNKY
jgi:hypothetical protein